MIQVHIKKTFLQKGQATQLHFDFEVKAHKVVTFFGDSGEGKTSLLRMIAGLLRPDEGFIKVNGNTWFDSEIGINIAPQQRDLGMVFQDYALFPSMTVLQNLHFASDKQIDHAFIDELLSLMDLGALTDRKPDTLSGGQQQRVALARTMVQKPAILLLDEPMSALDKGMRLKLQDFILKVHDKYKMTTLLVSHDIEEAIKMSDRILVIKKGEIVRDGDPLAVFQNLEETPFPRLKGTVLEILEHENGYLVSILIGEQVIQKTFSTQSIAEFKVGAEIWVEVK